MEGVRLFNVGQWWHAHEAWEAEWLEAQGERRTLLQALILLAAALHKRWVQGSLTHRNYHKAVVYLEQLPATCDRVKLAQLRADVWAALHTPALRPQIHFTDALDEARAKVGGEAGADPPANGG